MLKVIYFVLPNLEHFNIRSRIVYDLGIPDGYIAGAVLYGVLYASLLLIFSILIFNRKDHKHRVVYIALIAAITGGIFLQQKNLLYTPPLNPGKLKALQPFLLM